MNPIKVLFAKARSQLSKIVKTPSQQVSIDRTKLIPAVEEPDYYQSGGFHPISLGDTFKSDQYTILRKLGYGQYSTVWLAKDTRYQKYAALKILRADCYGGPHDIFEREILSRIQEVSQKSHHEGRSYVSGLLDHFKHTGPNGDHVCLVFDVLGHHLDFQAAKYEDGKLPVKAVKTIVRQLCGVIHTDLKPTNILLELESPNNTISQYLEKVPQRTSQGHGATVPLREVITTPLVSEMVYPQVRIIDFGLASWRENHLSDHIQSLALRAPEVTIGAPWDTGVDIWSLGCLVVEFVQGIVLFSGEASEDGTWTAEDDHLARIIEVLGPLPSHLIRSGKRAAHFFDEEGTLIRIPNLKPTKLERLINGTTKPFLKPSDMPEAEVPIFIEFVQGMLELDPGTRKSASELLQHEWIKA
ncbi:protein kinase [Aspergillus avenaceus]|uniref:non-specific serine/threonine protein kinase n=1 Tax=Aspergillus avenaceus TaxID=36643 RepID=A0A5N6U4Q5_ASPAV|nr:protein kinase [Aspergillus avenaceus]